MNTFTDDYNEFLRTHEYKPVSVSGHEFKVSDSGSGEQTIVFLNGMDLQQAWIRLIPALEKHCRIILMKYPVDVEKNAEMAALLHDLFAKLDIPAPILFGTSDGGVLAQYYAKKYKAGGLILLSTLTVDSAYVEAMKKEKFVMPFMRFYVKRVKFAKLRTMLISAVQKHYRNETEVEKAYATSFLEQVGTDESYRWSYLRALAATCDILNIERFSKSDFEYLKGKVLVLIPENDMFDKADSQKLVDIFTEPVVKQTYGGHLGWVMRPDLYLPDIEQFLSERF